MQCRGDAKCGHLPLLELSGRRLTFQPGGDLGGGIAVERPIEFLGDVADMRCRDDVLECPEWMAVGQWLGIEYIDRGSCDRALAAH